MTDISDQYELELQLVELEKKEEPKLDPKSYYELGEMLDEVLAMISERKRRKATQ